jgi:hypothetical protein
MHRTAALVMGVLFVGTAQAAPITLICNGSLTLDGKQSAIDRETAILDIEKQTFKPPLYPVFSLTRVADNDIDFGYESATNSTWGSLDRVSGSLSMNVMSPDDRKKLQAGGSARFLAWMTAKCAPAQRLF